MTKPHLNLTSTLASNQPQPQYQPQPNLNLNLNSIWLRHKSNPILCYKYWCYCILLICKGLSDSFWPQFADFGVSLKLDFIFWKSLNLRFIMKCEYSVNRCSKINLHPLLDFCLHWKCHYNINLDLEWIININSHQIISFFALI